MRGRWVLGALGSLWLAVAVACSAAEAPVAAPSPAPTVAEPPVAAVAVVGESDQEEPAVSETTGQSERILDFQPIRISGALAERSNGTRAAPLFPVALPTAAPAPVLATPVPAPTVTAAPAVVLVNNAAKVTCTIAYRTWLAEDKDWFDARDLHDRLPEFREARPDCAGEKFDPIFSQQRVCVYPGQDYGVRPYHSFLRDRRGQKVSVGPTRQNYVALLVHFAKLPTREEGGCWYYDRLNEHWTEAVVDEVGRYQNPNEPTPAPDESESRVARERIAACNRELRSRLEAAEPGRDAVDIAELILSIQTGIADCFADWHPEVAADGISAECPAAPSGKNADGDVVIHWYRSPDGSACWVRGASDGEWRMLGGDGP